MNFWFFRTKNELVSSSTIHSKHPSKTKLRSKQNQDFELKHWNQFSTNEVPKVRNFWGILCLIPPPCFRPSKNKRVRQTQRYPWYPLIPSTKCFSRQSSVGCVKFERLEYYWIKFMWHNAVCAHETKLSFLIRLFVNIFLIFLTCSKNTVFSKNDFLFGFQKYSLLLFFMLKPP